MTPSRSVTRMAKRTRRLRSHTDKKEAAGSWCTRPLRRSRRELFPGRNRDAFLLERCTHGAGSCERRVDVAKRLGEAQLRLLIVAQQRAGRHLPLGHDRSFDGRELADDIRASRAGRTTAAATTAA